VSLARAASVHGSAVTLCKASDAARFAPGDVIGFSHVDAERPRMRTGQIMVRESDPRSGVVYTEGDVRSAVPMASDTDYLYRIARDHESGISAGAGTFRVHFNRHTAAPLVWCVATDQWEIAVSSVVIDAEVRSVYRAKSMPDDEDGKPSAWLEVSGVLVVVGSEARITRGDR
jgi:hypothetical protein